MRIGADPEYALEGQYEQDEVIRPNKILANALVRRMTEGMTPYGSFGRDGSGLSLEIRPNPHSKPAFLVRNIGCTLVSLQRFLNQTADPLCRNPEIIYTGYHRIVGACGGHIHVSLGDAERRVLREARVAANYFLEEANFIFCMASLLFNIIDPVGSSIREERTGYGSLFDVRWQSWGVEIRHPTSAWTITPQIAKSSLHIFSKAIKGEFESFVQNPKLIKSIANAEDDPCRAWLENMHSDLRDKALQYLSWDTLDQREKKELRSPKTILSTWTEIFGRYVSTTELRRFLDLVREVKPTSKREDEVPEYSLTKLWGLNNLTIEKVLSWRF